MKGKRFSSLEEIKENTAAALDSIQEEEFSDCILVKWEKRWKRCVYSSGEYLEGDRSKIHAGCPLHTLEDVKEACKHDHTY